MKINFINLQEQYKKYKQEIDREINDVLNTSVYIGGEKIEKLEKALAGFVGSKHALCCSSGTDALLLALMALDIQPSDELITTQFAFIETAENCFCMSNTSFCGYR